jgi:hypothetical protein
MRPEEAGAPRSTALIVELSMANEELTHHRN